MLENVIKKLFPIRDEQGRPCTFPTFASQVFFNDGSVLEGKEFGGGADTVDPLAIYPVGSIYITTKDEETDRPAYRFGGTWERIQGRFLLASGSNAANSYTGFGSLSAGAINRSAGETGGEVKHKLTAAELAKHSHGSIVNVDWGEDTTIGAYMAYLNSDAIANTTASTTIKAWTMNASEEVGSNTAHNNMPPYEVVNVWKRVA